MLALALLASLCAAEPPKEKSISGVVASVTGTSVTLDDGASFRLTKDTVYLLETGRDPKQVTAAELGKGKAVQVGLVDGAATTVFIRRFVPLAPGEVPKNLTDLLAAPAAGEKTTVATGEWSEPVNGLRGRLVLARGRTLGDGKTRESLVYVELENVANTHSGKVTVAFDPDALKCELTDGGGKAVPPAPVPGSGGRPGKSSVTIPFDSSVRLRANPYGFGRAEGLLIPLNTTAWHLKEDGDYALSGTLTIVPPDGQADGWKGELKLPKVKISLKGK